MAAEIAGPKPDLGAKATKGRFWSTFYKKFSTFKQKIISAKIKKKNCCQSIIANLTQPLQHNLRSSAAMTIILRTQPQVQGTLTQPLHSNLQRRANQPTFLRSKTSITGKNNASCKSYYSNLIFVLAVPMWSSNGDSQTKIESQHNTPNQYSRTTRLDAAVPMHNDHNVIQCFVKN